MLGDGGGAVLLAGLGVALGLWLLARGMAGYRRASRIGDTSTSSIASAAAGEVRIAGVVEPAELILTSPLQGARCVYYRASVEEPGRGRRQTVYSDERAVGFRVRDPSGVVRVFPRGAQVDVPIRLDESSGSLGERPPGLHLRAGDAISVAEPDRETQIARLLTVRHPAGEDGLPFWLADAGGAGRAPRRFREARLEPGEAVTVVGHLLPFGDLPDPLGASDVTGALDPLSALEDPEIAADLAAARAAGLLEPDPAEAWGNAAIPGFGIGRPVRPPELDPAAIPAEVAEGAAGDETLFEIRADELVLAAAADAPLLIAAGTPGAAVQRQEGAFLVGLLGAVLAIASALVAALALAGLLG